MHIYRPKNRGRVSPTYWCWYYDARKRRIRRSTGCTDKRAAERAAARFEREAADPRAATTTLRRALERLVIDREERGKASGTVKMYRSKGGQLLRVLGDIPLDDIDASVVDDYIAHRIKGEPGFPGVTRNTIHKELTTLRAALRLARRRREYPHAIDEVMPVGFSASYVPREGYVKTPEDLRALLAALPAHRRGVVAFIVATGARISEALRARKADIDLVAGRVKIRGTKTAASKAVIPVVEHTRPLLEYALATMPFGAWGSYGRDLPAAAKRAGLERLTANDLRRTCATWLRQGGVAPHLIAAVLRHRDSRMVERVYGRMPVESLAGAIGAAVGDREPVTVH